MQIDIFNDDAFGVVEMTEALNRVPYSPELLGSLGIFTPVPIRTTMAYITERDGQLSVIQTSPRGAPLEEAGRDRRKMRAFATSRIAKGATIYADEIQNVRAEGDSTELQTAQTEIADKLTGPSGIMNEVELTFEHMRLGAIDGKVLDADGSTLVDWYDEFGIARPAAVNFALNVDTTNVRAKCDTLRRSLSRKAKGAFGPGTEIHALTGDGFHEKLVDHPAVRETYLNWQAAQDLRRDRSDISGAGSFDTFRFGGIVWHNYRGTDDESTVSVPSGKAKFFPVGTRNQIFRHVMAPGEFFEFVNTMGRREYSMVLRDRDRNAWVRPEVYSYPLFMCSRPDLLAEGQAE